MLTNHIFKEGFEVPNQGPWQERKRIPFKGRPEAWKDKSPDKDNDQANSY